ncbi:hypothetical protein StoSoilB13_49430 (plasmid) [Arthrobacter sp. StoSoilB13]|nr:hypothetical protein StoSoilB13_49430 [Arthrobacter sp. StoSoilB13]
MHTVLQIGKGVNPPTITGRLVCDLNAFQVRSKHCDVDVVCLLRDGIKEIGLGLAQSEGAWGAMHPGRLLGPK